VFTFVRGLKGGGFIAGFGSQLFVYDGAGNLLRAISLGTEVFDVLDAAFSPDAQFLYVSLNVSTGSPNALYSMRKLRIADGAVVTTTPATNIAALTVSVLGENRPTAEEIAAAAVPTLSTLALFALAAALALTALRRVG
jgi:hypothetical protein